MFNLAKSESAVSRGIIPEGTYVLKVIFVDYQKALGRMTLTLATAKGQRHYERFYFVSNAGKTNQVAIDRFWWFAETALNNADVSETGFDEQELVGRYIRVTVKHNSTPNPNDPDNPYVNARLSNFRNANRFDEAEVTKPADATVDPLDLL